MSHVLLDAARVLGDVDLDRHVRSLAARGRAATVELVAHLGEIDERGVALAAGYASLWEYCLEALHLSEGEASNRIAAARAARRYPAILDLLSSGEINLTTVRETARYLTPENHEAVLASVRGLRKDAVLRLMAALAPRPDAPTLLRRERPAPTTAVALVPASAPATASPAPTAPRLPPPSRPTTTPLAPARFRYQTTLSEDVVDMIRCARDMLSHTAAGRDDDEILRRALAALLQQLARERFSATDDPRPGRPTALGSRHVPAEVRRAVWVRDAGRCAFVAADGRRCTARAFLQFHHVKPYAAGGPATATNIQLRCGAHNRFEARAFEPRGDDAGPTGVPPPGRAVPQAL